MDPIQSVLAFVGASSLIALGIAIRTQSAHEKEINRISELVAAKINAAELHAAMTPVHDALSRIERNFGEHQKEDREFFEKVITFMGRMGVK